MFGPAVLSAAELPLRFGGSNWYPPFHYPVASGKRAEGFDIAVLESVASRAGFAVQYRFDGWDRIQQALASGEIDIVPMFISEERSQRFLFSDPVGIEYHQVFGRDEGRSLSSLREVAGLRVATEQTSYAAGQLLALGIPVELLEAASEADALRMVRRGDADIALVPVSVALHTIANEGLNGLRSLSPPLLPVTYAFAINQNRPELLAAINTQLAAMQRDGSLHDLRNEWLSGRRSGRSGWPASLLLLFASGGLIVGYRILRRRISKPAGLSPYFVESQPDEEASMLLRDLRLALDNKDLAWVIQPQYSVSAGSIIGGEMLVRWDHPEQGFIAPDRFIGLAEHGGLIRDLTHQAIDQARLILRDWQRQDLDYTLSVNVSANDFADPQTLAHIIDAMRGFEWRIILEITETAIMRDVESILRAMDELRAASIRISLDDYGTGYSSMSYLKEFNFDEIKIDRLFTSDLLKDKRNLLLTRASTKLGHELGAQVVAEGVEDVETAIKLVEVGCDVLQGYMIARPMTLANFDKFARDAVIVLPTLSTSPGERRMQPSGLVKAWQQQR